MFKTFVSNVAISFTSVGYLPWIFPVIFFYAIKSMFRTVLVFQMSNYTNVMGRKRFPW